MLPGTRVPGADPAGTGPAGTGPAGTGPAGTAAPGAVRPGTAPPSTRLARLGEHRQGHLVAIEGPGGTGVGRQVDKQLDDLFLGHPGVQRDAQLAAERLMGAEGGGDGDRDERPAAVVESFPRPGRAEGRDGGESPEVLPDGRFPVGEAENQRFAE